MGAIKSPVCMQGHPFITRIVSGKKRQVCPKCELARTHKLRLKKKLQKSSH